MFLIGKLLYQEGVTLKKKQKNFLPLLHEFNALDLAGSIIEKYELVELYHVPYAYLIITSYFSIGCLQ